MNPKSCIYGDHIFSTESMHMRSDKDIFGYRGIIGCAVCTVLSIGVSGILLS